MAYSDGPYTDHSDAPHDDHIDSGSRQQHADDGTSRLRQLEGIVEQLVANQRRLVSGLQIQFGRLSKELGHSFAGVERRLRSIEAQAAKLGARAARPPKKRP
jgi:hypothetical protein